MPRRGTQNEELMSDGEDITDERYPEDDSLGKYFLDVEEDDIEEVKGGQEFDEKAVAELDHDEN